MTRRTTDEPLIFAPSESGALGLAASERAGITLAALEERQYEGGEFKLRPLQSGTRSDGVRRAIAGRDSKGADCAAPGPTAVS